MKVTLIKLFNAYTRTFGTLKAKKKGVTIHTVGKYYIQNSTIQSDGIYIMKIMQEQF